MVGGVGDRQELALGQAVGEEVVEHAAVLAAEHAVLGSALRDPADVVGEHPLKERERLRAACQDLTHVRDVEHADAVAHAHVLGGDPASYWTGISHPANGHELAAGGDVTVVQRGAAERGLSGGGHSRSGYRVGSTSGGDSRRVPAASPPRARQSAPCSRARRGAQSLAGAICTVE